MPPKIKPAASTASASDMSLDEKVNHIFNMVNKIDATLNEQHVRIVKVETDVKELNKEVYALKNIVNAHEQELHSSTIRIMGLPFTEEEKTVRSAADLKQRAFDRILGPILTVASEQDLLSERPFVGNTINACYRIGAASAKANTGSPPPLIVKLRSSETRINILKCKRDATFGPNQAEKELGIKFFSISEDLTQPAYKKMKELKSHEDVEKVWSYEGRLQFTLKGSKTVHKVLSVHDDVDTIFSKIQSLCHYHQDYVFFIPLRLFCRFLPAYCYAVTIFLSGIYFFLIHGAHLRTQIFLRHFLLCYILFISCV